MKKLVINRIATKLNRNRAGTITGPAPVIVAYCNGAPGNSIVPEYLNFLHFEIDPSDSFYTLRLNNGQFEEFIYFNTSGAHALDGRALALGGSTAYMAWSAYEDAGKMIVYMEFSDDYPEIYGGWDGAECTLTATKNGQLTQSIITFSF